MFFASPKSLQSAITLGTLRSPARKILPHVCMDGSIEDSGRDEFRTSSEDCERDSPTERMSEHPHPCRINLRKSSRPHRENGVRAIHRVFQVPVVDILCHRTLIGSRMTAVVGVENRKTLPCEVVLLTLQSPALRIDGACDVTVIEDDERIGTLSLRNIQNAGDEEPIAPVRDRIARIRIIAIEHVAKCEPGALKPHLPEVWDA